MRRAFLLSLALLSCLAATAAGQSVSGQVFVDLNTDGIRQPAETGVAALPVTVYGTAGETAGTTAADGTFSLTTTAGCRGVFMDFPSEPDPALGTTGNAWRRIEADSTTCATDGSNPVGRTRYGVARYLRQHLSEPSITYIQLGDSIAAGVSVCFWLDTDYSNEVASDLDCLGSSSISRDNRAVGGWHSEDLLTPTDGGSANAQFIPNVVTASPDLVTMSIGGNDFLNTEPGGSGQNYPFPPADLQASLQELIHTRRSVQEILSVLTTELPGADIEINSVYDNLAPDCATTDFHAAAPPMWNQMLRHLAWGQVRPAQVAEVAPEFAHENINRTSCCGNRGMICALDNIHPTDVGADIIQYAVMESLGRVQVGAGGATGFDIGALQLVAVVHPTIATIIQDSAAISTPDAAIDLDGTGARVGSGGILELSGFSLPAGVTPLRMVAGVRYRTTAGFSDDTYTFDASVLDFAAPQWTFTGWDTVTPIVGGSGTAGNIGTPSVVNALTNVSGYRDVTAMVTLNAVDDGRATGSYSWPAPTATDVANLKVRVAVNPVGTPDAAQVDWDGAWLWVYGTRAGGGGTPPGEVSGGSEPAVPLLVTKRPGSVVLTWGDEPLADTYRAWVGNIGAWNSATCQPGVVGGCVPAPTLTWTQSIPSDSHSDWYFLVSAVNADGDGPIGFDSFGVAETSNLPGCP